MRGSRAGALLTPRAVKVLIGLPLVLAGFALALQVRTPACEPNSCPPILCAKPTSDRLAYLGGRSGSASLSSNFALQLLTSRCCSRSPCSWPEGSHGSQNFLADAEGIASGILPLLESITHLFAVLSALLSPTSQGPCWGTSLCRWHCCGSLGTRTYSSC